MGKEEIIEVGQREQEVLVVDDSVIAIAKQAEARVEAVKKIKQTALSVTNAKDWVDQQGNPYLMASGAEKIANLFGISWNFLDPEPKYEEDEEGHYTYTFRGRFVMGGREVECEGTRSSRDKFFSQYDYKKENGKEIRVERPLVDRDNKRDVKMAALTNLLGNGITRILGIRNLTWEDLAAYAKIKKEEVSSRVRYNKKDPGTLKEPQENGGKQPEIKDPDAPATEAQVTAINAILKKLGVTDDYAGMDKVSKIIGKDGEPLTSATALTKGQASLVIQTLQKEVKS